MHVGRSHNVDARKSRLNQRGAGKEREGGKREMNPGGGGGKEEEMNSISATSNLEEGN